MRKHIAALALVFGALAWADNARTLQVEVSYTGAGKVDANHKIYVFLWDSPEFASAPPIATKALDSKTGTLTFENIEPGKVYMAVAFDPSGGWSADSPPPSGASVALYGENPPTPDAIEIAPGKTVKVKIAFDDSSKMP